MKSNQDIRDYAANHKVLLWECAEKLGIADTTFSKKMRREFSAEEKQKVFSIIDAVSASRKEA
ncbi:MAG: hypothetical protein K1W33_06810 [Clostridia bacterium]